MVTMLPMNEQITDVLAVRALSDEHPVFLLTVNGTKHTVVSGRIAGGAKQLFPHLATIGRADPGRHARVLDAGEYQAIQEFVAHELELSRKLGGQGPACDDVRRLKAMCDAAPVGAIIKIATHEGIPDLSMVPKGAAGKSALRHIAEALNAPGGFERLGRIVAADMYHHNTDRFHFGGLLACQQDTATNERTGGKFRILVHPGNVVVAIMARGRETLGLDPVDPASPFKDLQRPLAALESDSIARGGSPWWGRLLKDDAGDLRQAAARYIVEDIEAALVPRSRRMIFLSARPRLDADGHRRLLAGLEEARLALLQKARDRHCAIGTADPVGLADRCQILLGLVP